LSIVKEEGGSSGGSLFKGDCGGEGGIRFARRWGHGDISDLAAVCLLVRDVKTTASEKESGRPYQKLKKSLTSFSAVFGEMFVT